MYAAQTIYIYLALGFTAILCIVFLSLFLKRNDDYKELFSKYNSSNKKLKLKLYENRVLAELGIKFGYSLNVELVAHTVIGSLQEVLPYSVAAYALLEGKVCKYKFHLMETVPRTYIDKVKTQMHAKLNDLSVSDIDKMQQEESIFGEYVGSEPKKVGSIVNLPLVVSGDVVGTLSISSTSENAFHRDAISVIERVVEKSTEAVTNLHELIRHEKGKLEVMVESMSDGVLLIDQDFRVLLANPACAKLLGIRKKSNSAVLDKILDSTSGLHLHDNKSYSINIFDIVSALSSAFSVEETIAQVFSENKTRSVSNISVKGRHLSVVITPIKLDSSTKGVGMLFHDQSKEWKLKQLREDFTAMIVHELRSPLTVVNGTADLLLKQYDRLTKEQIQLLLGQVQTSVSSLLSIVNDLLDAAKIEAGKFEVFKDEEHDLKNLITEEANYYSNLAADKNLSIDIQTSGNLKPFRFDKDKIRQVLNNLISNAIKFTSHGVITVHCKVLENQVQVIVADTGKGIPDEQKAKLFNKFSQVNPNNHKGTGLGLVIAKGIVESHGGSIWVEDNFPQGSRFVFTLPLA